MYEPHFNNQTPISGYRRRSLNLETDSLLGETLCFYEAVVFVGRWKRKQTDQITNKRQFYYLRVGNHPSATFA